MKTNKTNSCVIKVQSIFVLLLIVSFFIISVTTAEYTHNTNGFSTLFSQVNESFDYESIDDVEYWALLIAVGVYYQVPEMNRPTMLREVANFEQVLLSSSNWDEDHIKVIKGEDATVRNIYQGFKWLDSCEDENDFSLVYLTTHGFPHWWDRPPFDEADGKDEALASYHGFLPYESPFRWEHMSNPFGIILDDQFNHWFNQLESKGVGVIVDSCHSGGFDDYYQSLGRSEDILDFAFDLGMGLQGQNRIVVTSVPEEDVSYGSFFSHYLIEGFQGKADSNDDGVVTMEESFYYAEKIIEQQTNMDPQIFDNYPGEFPVTSI